MHRFLIFVFIGLASPFVIADNTDLVGEWRVKQTSIEADGSTTSYISTDIHKSDHTFISNFILCIEVDGLRAVTISGTDTGEWSYRNGEMRQTSTTYTIDFFSSLSKDLSRAEIKKVIDEESEKETKYRIKKLENGGFIAIDTENNSRTSYHPLNLPVEKGIPYTAPLKTLILSDLKQDPTRSNHKGPDHLGVRLRQVSEAILKKDGFKASASLPTFKKRNGIKHRARPLKEIQNRLICNFIVALWILNPQETLPDQAVHTAIKNLNIRNYFSKKERSILALKRIDAAKTHSNSIGWSIESMTVLAWAMGYEVTPDINQEQISEQETTDLFAFIGKLLKKPNMNLEKVKGRSLAEIAQLEDLFYCAHNAVRSAQLGNKVATPDTFHPIHQGGVIHEKRHALTWLLSPGIPWEMVDLST